MKHSNLIGWKGWGFDVLLMSLIKSASLPIRRIDLSDPLYRTQLGLQNPFE